MALLVVITLAGGVATTALLWPWVGPVAVLAAPLGGSLLAVMVSGYLAWHVED
jgi:hypothetical protein